jgi:hypothetical protein
VTHIDDKDVASEFLRLEFTEEMLAEARKNQPKPWKCFFCKEDNPPPRMACRSCNKKKRVAPVEEEKGDEISVGSSWECLNCKYLNPQTRKNCFDCGQVNRTAITRRKSTGIVRAGTNP